MSSRPLFMRFLNGKADSSDIARSFLSSTKCEESQGIIQEFLDSETEYPLDQFRSDLTACLKDILDQGVDEPIRRYFTDYMKPSLLEYNADSSIGRTGFEDRWVGIADKEAPWIEALVCYNLLMYIKAFGTKSLKRCPVCEDFFGHKGKYSVYCSDRCKNSPLANSRRG